MDSVQESVKTSAAAQTHFILQENQCFVNKILSRNSSVGRSSHFYYRNPGDVPFNWEVKPGKPKEDHPPHDHDDADIFPPSLGPPGPPPAVHSEGISRPSVESSPRLRIFLWKKFMKNLIKAKKFQAMSRLKRENSFVRSEHGGDKFDEFELTNSKNDFGGSSSLQSFFSSNGSSSCSSSSSNSVLALYQRSKLHKLGKGFVRWAFQWRER
ncbi:hypothetical protein I3843_08G036000 [Carya illinoinensis]|nr:hypothetical protein I3843_08G036000 [Carya illinoinensis]